MGQILSSAAVVIGALRFKLMFPSINNVFLDCLRTLCSLQLLFFFFIFHRIRHTARLFLFDFFKGSERSTKYESCKFM